VTLQQKSSYALLPKAHDESDELIEDLINSEDDKIEFFFIVNYLFSLLIDFDKLDAARIDFSYFKNNLEDPVSDVGVYLDHCRKQDPAKFDPAKPINELRNNFLSEIENSNNISHNNHFYSITAPTGIGKTFGCMAFAKKLKEKLQKGSGRIIYCLPYTSIIDQNYLEFERIIKSSNKDYQKKPHRYLLKHHCLTKKKIINRKADEEYQFKDYLDDRLLVESWQSSMIVTTFVQFFHTLIGNRNKFLKKFHNIINSIVILDEVQNIDPDYYKLLRRTFNIIGKRFNTYFVLVTATQPVIFDKNEIVSVVDYEKYMTAAVFNRVRLTIKPGISTLEEFRDHFINSFQGRNCLIVMNTKKYAQTTYNLLKKHFPNYEIYCLTTKLTPWDRKKQIAEIRKHLENKIKVIVVSTQLIEAGVDLSFKVVYRDVGPMDSIVQVAGRCNRHGEYGFLGGEMILLNFNNHNIYKMTLIQYVNQSIEKESYESKDFHELSEKYFNRFNFMHIGENFLSAIYNLNYDRNVEDQIPISMFSLIEDLPTETLFILRTPMAQKDMETLIKHLSELKNSKLPKERKNVILFEIEKLKYHLNQFSISVYENEILSFKSIIEPYDIDDDNKSFFYRYISYKNQFKYAYDDKLGLCQKPKKQLSDSITF
jgi:CRISPR-associated endonuclease/helicase Cas3